MSFLESPLISVIVPVYNVESYLDACLNSIKQQTYQNLEIIVVEDCSTDSSSIVLQPHLTDERVKLIQHAKNSGLSAARNTGIDAATGEYIMFVDSDDIIDPRLIDACLDCMKSTTADLVTYDFTPFEDGVFAAELPYPPSNLEFEKVATGEDYFNHPHFAWLKFIRSSVVKSAALAFPVGLYYEDWPFHWELGLSTKSRFHLPVGFYLYRQRGTSITGSTGKKLLDLFVIHSRVMKLIQDYKAHAIKKLLANKVRHSHWSILTRIDYELLESALNSAKEANKKMKLNDFKSDFAIRNIIVVSIVRMPNSLALPALKVLRKALRIKSGQK